MPVSVLSNLFLLRLIQKFWFVHLMFKHSKLAKFKTRELLTLIFFHKQPVYKQLVLGWQIAKQLSGLNTLSLSNSKNYRLKKWSLPF